MGTRKLAVESADYLARFDPHELLIASTRYFVGRRSIATVCFARTLAEAWPSLPEHTRAVIERDLEEAFRLDEILREEGEACTPLGDNCAREAWELVRAAYRATDNDPKHTEG